MTGRRSGRSALRRPAFIAAAAAFGWMLAGCAPSVLAPAGPVGAADRTILFNALAIMLAIVVPTMAATLAFAWWFRAGNRRARYLPEFAYSGRIELVTWSIPVLVILFLGGICWIGSHDLDPAEPLDAPAKPLDIEAVSLDWKWLFIYPDQGIAAVNELTVPVNVPLHFSLTSASVMNVFFVPQLGSMIYTMNGMSDRLNLEAAKEGTYYGQSAHFSGDGFSDMHFDVSAVSGERFDAWVGAARARGPALDAAAYAELAKQGGPVAPFTYRTVAEGLYRMIVTQKLPPGPGPTPATSPRTQADTMKADDVR
jgi:cytochrome o ubiquinol oxidase subunit 2